MSFQLALCSRVIKTGNITPVLEWGITPDDFTIEEAKNLWALLLSYYSTMETQGSVIDNVVLQNWFKHWSLPDDMSGMTTETLCYQVRRERVCTESNSLAVKFTQEIAIGTQNPASSLAWFHGDLTRLIALGTTKNTDVSAKQGLASVRAKLQQMKDGIDFSVMKWPWQALNDATFGVQPDDYVVFYGRPKSMKTWVLCSVIAWAFEQQKKVLVYTKEMTPDNLYNRVYACILNLIYDELRGGTTSNRDDQRLAELAAMMETDAILANQLTVLSGQDAPPGGDTVPWLESKVSTYKPAIMFVDGMYLLSAHQKWKSDEERVRMISRALRAMVLKTGVPVIATMQATRKASAHNNANLDEIAYSDALSQDCTIAARVINDKASPTISVVIGGSREFKLHGFRINGIPARDFSFHSVLGEKDIMDAKEGDQAEIEEKNAAAKPKKKAAKNGQGTEPPSLQEQMRTHFGSMQAPNLMPDRLTF